MRSIFIRRTDPSTRIIRYRAENHGGTVDLFFRTKLFDTLLN